MRKLIILSALCLVLAGTGHAETKAIGIYGGIGTDITLGLAAGGGVSYLLTDLTGLDMEIGGFLFYSYSVDTYTEGSMDNEYTETTSMFLLAVLANILFSYPHQEPGVYFIAGAGAMATSIDWEIESDDDPTANDTWSGVGGGLLINLGMGYAFGGGFELRLQLPVFVVFAEYGAARFAPMFVLLAGFRF